MDPVRCPNGCRTGLTRESPIFFISTGPVRDPQGCLAANLGARELTRPEFAKIPHRRRMWPYGARTAPYDPRTGWSRLLSPYGTRKLIIDALKIYGPRTGRQNSHGAALGPFGPREWTCDFCSKQPLNSLEAVRTGSGSVMWLGH